MDLPKILAIWQPVGYSTHIVASKVSEKHGVLTSHTGTLDPMAEGVVIVLLDEERNKKYEYAKWLKEYEFEIVFGLSTDTYDGLGMVTAFHEGEISKETMQDALTSFKGEYTQEVPPYSAIKVEGKPMHWYARNRKLSGLEIPRRDGEIHEIELVDFYSKDFGVVVKELKEKISKVTGDLRQEQIKTRWAQLEESVGAAKAVQVAKVRVVMTKGLYVRSLSQDIAHKIEASGFVFSLTRTKNGEYGEKNSKTLEEVFGKNYLDNYNFTSRSNLAS